MKLPQWNSTAPLEHRKTTAQLRQFTPMHTAPKQRFIPTLTSSQVMQAGMAKANAIGRAFDDVARVVGAVQDAKEDGELRAAQARYLTDISTRESEITRQPHEVPELDGNGQPVIDQTTGLPKLKRPYETALDDYDEVAKRTAQGVSESILTSEGARQKFSLYVAQQDSTAKKRIQKWQIGHMIDRANATHISAIEQAKTHAQVEDEYHNALSKYVDPPKAQAARKAAHQRITFVPLNNHLMQVQTNMMNMGAEEVSGHLGQIYSDWNAVKHTLSADQSKAVLNGLVSADKDYWNRARKEGQQRHLMQDLMDYGMADPLTKESIRDQILSGDVYERYGEGGKSFIVDMVKHERFGVDTPEGLGAAAALHKDAFFGVDSTEDSLQRLHTISKNLSIDTVVSSMKEIQRNHESGAAADNKLANTLFQAATTSVMMKQYSSGVNISSAMVADAQTDLALMQQNYRALIREAEKAGQIPDRMAIATDVLTTLKLPAWAVDNMGKPAASITDVDIESSAYARKKILGLDPDTMDDNEERDMELLKERQRQVSRILDRLL